MAGYDFKAQRLCVGAALGPGIGVEATAEQANYLKNVLRLGVGDTLLLFNGRDGEWRGEIAAVGKRSLTLRALERTREQEDGPDLVYLFAPLKRARLDYMVEKATEMGVAVLQPVITRHTQAERVNTGRLRLHAIEAAEQCGILRLPEVREPIKLTAALDGWDGRRCLVFADENAGNNDPLAALRALPAGGPLALLVGPEGGFEAAERAKLRALPFVTAISLGPRILRADTAAVAALALLNAVLGDWR
jgi:16S rRNA (uracil1498-N3)-methyltransferase